MGVMVACGAAVLVGLVAVVRWGGLEGRLPARYADGSPAARYLWHVTIAVSSGLAAGALVLGPGGRLVMRLLAATAGDDAQGKVTEAEEVVGRITVDGTIGLILFAGLLGGLLSAVLFALVRRWLPVGRLGGLAFGLLVLVIAAPRLDPLRRDNVDFDIVGPGWLAVAAFSALIVLHGMTVAALSSRFRERLPMPAKDRRVLVRYLPLLPLLALPAAVIVIALFGVIWWAVASIEDVAARLRSPAVMRAGRFALLFVGAIATPALVASVVDIAGRGP